MSTSTDIRILDPKTIRLFRRAGALALAVANESEHVNVLLVRSFPLSDPDHYWALLDSDGKDIGVIADPSALDSDTRTVAREEMEKRYFIPVIRRVIRARDDHGSIVWHVETDRGERTFTVRNMKDSLVELGGGRLLLVDVDGNRFEVSDMRKLDAKSFDLILRSL